jgi:hypothetical protein
MLIKWKTQLNIKEIKLIHKILNSKKGLIYKSLKDIKIAIIKKPKTLKPPMYLPILSKIKILKIYQSLLNRPQIKKILIIISIKFPILLSMNLAQVLKLLQTIIINKSDIKNHLKV